MPTVLIAANPKSGNADRHTLVEKLQALLEKGRVQAVVVQNLEELEQRVKTLSLQDQLQAVVAAGGDGTVSAVLSRIPPECPIAILPLGSENLLAKHYGITRSPEQCAQSVLAGRTSVLDAMEIQHASLPRPMIATLMASIGFDSDVVRLVHLNRRSHITRWAYRIQAIKSWWSYRWPIINISVPQSSDSAVASFSKASDHDTHLVHTSVDASNQSTNTADVTTTDAPTADFNAVGGVKNWRATSNASSGASNRSGMITYQARWLFVFNVPEYAAGLKILSDADPTDGKLAVGFFSESGRFLGLFQYLSVLMGNHRSRKDWKELQSTQLQINYQTSEMRGTNDGRRPIASLQVDGDCIGEPPATITLLPNRIRLLHS